MHDAGHDHAFRWVLQQEHSEPRTSCVGVTNHSTRIAVELPDRSCAPRGIHAHAVALDRALAAGPTDQVDVAADPAPALPSKLVSIGPLRPACGACRNVIQQAETDVDPVHRLFGSRRMVEGCKEDATVSCSSGTQRVDACVGRAIATLVVSVVMLTASSARTYRRSRRPVTARSRLYGSQVPGLSNRGVRGSSPEAGITSARSGTVQRPCVSSSPVARSCTPAA